MQALFFVPCRDDSGELFIFYKKLENLAQANFCTRFLLIFFLTLDLRASDEVVFYRIYDGGSPWFRAS